VHDELIALRGSPDTETLGRLAMKLGYEAQPILDMMSDDKVTEIIRANHELAGQLNITGTPTFVVDQALLRGYLPEEDMRKVVEEQRGS
jgi:protein-disulfide isomerase